MSKLIYESVVSIATAIRNKEISSSEIVKACLDRIEVVNPKLNAVIQKDADKALSEAKKLDEELALEQIRGSLNGVPMIIKDNLDTKDYETTGGTKGRKDFVPERDATVVARLRAEGAILFGKTNTPELTLAFETDNLVYGRTNNPYDVSRTRGGSSGGAAANGIMSPTSEIKSAVESAAKALSDVGIKVDEARPSGIEQTFNLFMGLIREHYVFFATPTSLTVSTKLVLTEMSFLCRKNNK